ncbi:MAG TPA: SatD family protein [Nocardioidaceae bacterium]|nr:SatD family protein [Nocardioidaceae bacterium]
MPDKQTEYDEQGVAVIGDVVSSRTYPDRVGLQARLARALEKVNRSGRVPQDLHITLGDEFQGVVGSMPAAVRLGIDVRLELLPDVEVRIGIGVGRFRVFDPGTTPLAQDGPAWWAARAAVDAAKTLAERPASRHVRSRAQALEPDGSEPVGSNEAVAVANAYLGLQDFLLSSMRPRELRLLAATLSGEPQREIAAREGITQSAVSQAMQASGARALLQSLDALGTTAR